MKRTRELRSIQIDRAVGKKVPIFPSNHPCYVDDGHILIRVSIPYYKGVLLLAVLRGQESRKHFVRTYLQMPILPLDVDFVNKKPHQLTRFTIHRSALAMGYKAAEPIGNKYRVEKRLDWFTPEVLRAA